MFSETLLVADRNTVKLMIDELRQQLSERDAALSEKDAEIKLLKEKLKQQNSK